MTQFGEPVRVIREPGLHWKLPFIQTVLSFDRRLLDFDSASQEVVLGSQRRLVVDAFTRYRITDPLRFFQTVGATEAGIRSRLEPSVTSALRGALANETLPAVLSAERARIMGEIRQRVEADTQDLGIDVVDVRIRRADLPEQNTQPILQRMQSERERVAREVRARGAEQAQRIVASADRERTVLLAEAQAKANALRGEGEQAAITIFAEAFQRDPEFFQFYRTMQAWREAFSDGETRMLLEPGLGVLPLFPFHSHAGKRGRPERRRGRRRRWRRRFATALALRAALARPVGLGFLAPAAAVAAATSCPARRSPAETLARAPHGPDPFQHRGSRHALLPDGPGLARGVAARRPSGRAGAGPGGAAVADRAAARAASAARRRPARTRRSRCRCATRRRASPRSRGSFSRRW